MYVGSFSNTFGFLLCHDGVEEGLSGPQLGTGHSKGRVEQLLARVT